MVEACKLQQEVLILQLVLHCPDLQSVLANLQSMTMILHIRHTYQAVQAYKYVFSKHSQGRAPVPSSDSYLKHFAVGGRWKAQQNEGSEEIHCCSENVWTVYQLSKYVMTSWLYNTMM